MSNEKSSKGSIIFLSNNGKNSKHDNLHRSEANQIRYPDKQALTRMQICCKIASIWEMFHLKHNANSHWEMSLKKKERKTLHVLFGVMSF